MDEMANHEIAAICASGPRHASALAKDLLRSIHKHKLQCGYQWQKKTHLFHSSETRGTSACPGAEVSTCRDQHRIYGVVRVKLNGPDDANNHMALRSNTANLLLSWRIVESRGFGIARQRDVVSHRLGGAHLVPLQERDIVN